MNVWAGNKTFPHDGTTHNCRQNLAYDFVSELAASQHQPNLSQDDRIIVSFNLDFGEVSFNAKLHDGVNDTTDRHRQTGGRQMIPVWAWVDTDLTAEECELLVKYGTDSLEVAGTGNNDVKKRQEGELVRQGSSPRDRATAAALRQCFRLRGEGALRPQSEGIRADPVHALQTALLVYYGTRSLVGRLVTSPNCGAVRRKATQEAALSSSIRNGRKKAGRMMFPSMFHAQCA